VHGWVRIAPHSRSAEVLRSTRRWWLLGSGPARELQVRAVRTQGAALVAKWDGCDSPEAAEALKGAAVAVARSDFPPAGEREYYWVDLIGLQVVNRCNRPLGVVRGLRSSAAHDLLEIEPPGGAALILVPVIGDYFDGVDAEAGTVRVNWEPEWLE
jgi:16S rRNA processing protein RimM